MIYIFEDKEDDILSRLFRKSYSIEATNKFVYSNGNGMIIKTVEEYLKEIQEEICVFLDTIPGNDSIHRIYSVLRLMSMQNNFRIVVMPIVCTEYYFIKSIADKGYLFKGSSDIGYCINRGYYRDSKIYLEADETYKVKCNNFEKYCKLILMTCVIDCVKHSRKDNTSYGRYYEQDCKCASSLNECIDRELNLKSYELLRQYPCVPGNSDIKSENKKEINNDKMWIVHRKLVEEFNKMSDMYSEKDISSKYKHIKPIR